MMEKNSIEKREFASLIFLEGNFLDSKKERGMDVTASEEFPLDFNPTRVILGLLVERRKRKKRGVMDRN